jgi:hypothetical protein
VVKKVIHEHSLGYYWPDIDYTLPGSGQKADLFKSSAVDNDYLRDLSEFPPLMVFLKGL